MNRDSSITLKLLNGANAGKSQVFQAGEILVGKDPRCDFVVNQRGVSRMHFRLEHSDEGWQLIDLRSTNGTIVGNSTVVGGDNDKPFLLPGSTQVRIGEAQIEINLPTVDRTEIVHLDSTNLSGQPLPEARSSTRSVPDKGTHIFTVAPTQANPRPKAKGDLRAGVAKAPENKDDRETREITSDDSCATLDHSSSSKLPRLFRDYRIVKSIGIGGMGQVFLAAKANSKEPVAIKFLKPQGDDSELNRARFLREMEITSSLEHPSIVRIIECGDESGQLFIAMEYCNGGNLAELLSRSKALTLRRAVRLMDRLLAGVELAHASGFVHRDLKPQNIILHKDAAGKFKPKITDFGLAKSYLQAGDSGMTANGTVGGSWAYMPMEQLTNFRFVSPSCDVWSLGAMLYESITGRLPRQHQPGMDPIRAILNSTITPLEQLLPDAPKLLSKFIHRCLDDDATKRFNDGAEMRTALRNLASKLDIEL
ncbi:MAG: FHA domain-containing serine/threonine-protein kinase [Pirellulales bacterium]